MQQGHREMQKDHWHRMELQIKTLQGLRMTTGTQNDHSDEDEEMKLYIWITLHFENDVCMHINIKTVWVFLIYISQCALLFFCYNTSVASVGLFNS